MDISNINYMDRWVPLGSLWLYADNIVDIIDLNNRCWLSKLHSFKKLINLKKVNSYDIWYHLSKVCDGIRIDTMIERIIMNNNIKPDLNLIEYCRKYNLESNNTSRNFIVNFNNTISVPIKKSVNVFRATVWINLSIKLLSKYNCNRAILSVPNFNSFYQIIFHLNTVIYDDTLVCNHRDICLYNLYYEMLRGNLIRNTKHNTIESSYNKDLGKLSYSYCNILGCLEHVKAPNFFSKDINISDLMDCIEVKVSKMTYNGNFILDTNNLTKNMETDHKEDYHNMISSSNSAFSSSNNTQLNLDFIEYGLGLIHHSNKIQGINTLPPKEIWLGILDYLDVLTCKEFGRTCRLFKSIWLIHHHNNLLPHQRQSVAWLLQREFGSLNYKNYVDNGDNNWIFDSNPIKFLRHCNDEFKSLSFWYYIPIQGFLKNDDLILLIKKSINSQLICNIDEIFGEIIQDHLFGLKIHPSIILENFGDISKLFCKDWIPSCCLYVSHCNQVIYFGYLPNSNEINSDYTKLSMYGDDILGSYTHHKKYKDRQIFYKNFGGILCDDPGLGKTLTILSLISKTPNCLSKIDIENFSKSGIIHFPRGVQYLVRDIHNGNISFLYEKNNQECINRYLGDKMNYLEFKKTLEINNMGNRRKYRSNLQNSGMQKNMLQSKSTLILVPNHLIQHWKSELKKWFAVPKLSEYDYSLKREQSRVQNEDNIEIRKKRVKFDLNNLNNKERDYSEPCTSNKSDKLVLHMNKEDHTIFGNLLTAEARIYSKELFSNNPNSVYLNHKKIEGYIEGNEALLQSPIFIFDDPRKDIIPDAEILSKSNIVILSYRMLTKQFQMCKIKKEYTRISSKVQKNSSKIKSLSINSDKSCKTSCSSLDLANSQFEYVNSPILKIKWLRLIVDEGHNIGSSSITSSLYKQFIFKIESNYRWIMSGTPLPVSLYKCINTYIPNIFEFLRLPIIWSKRKNWNLGDDIKNVFKVDNLPEYSSLLNGDPFSSNLIQEDSIINEYNYSDDFIYDKFISDNIVTEPSNSVFKSITKKSTSDKHGDFISPMGLFGLILQLGSITVYHRKDSCLKNYLPNLIGPEKIVLRPFIKNELLVYNILVELLQRNLFCTFYNTENVDSLLHTSNAQYRQDILWNLRFSSVLGFIVTLSKLEGNRDLSMDYIYNICKIPKLFVNSHDIQELELMLLNTHPLYVNNLYYNIYSMDRLKFVLYLYSRFNGADLDFDYDENGLIYKNTCNYNLSYDSHTKALYKCDNCQKPVIFPLIIPCKYLHLTCINCIMFKLGYKPIEVKWDCSDKNEYNSLKGYGNFQSYMNNLNYNFTLQCKNSNYISQNIIEHNKSTSRRYIWPKRAGVNYCIICGPEIRINSDFFDRLQVPIQIKYPESATLKDYQNTQNREINTYSRSDQHNIIHNNVNLCGTFSKIFPVSILNTLKELLIGSFDDPKINSILTRLYTEKIVQDTDVRINNMYTSETYFATSVHLANKLPIAALISLSSSKLRYVIHCILNNLDTYPRSKIMIVSNFWQQLDFLYNTLNIFNIRTCRFYPHIPKTESLFTINDFQTKPDISVLLLSVELGSHGLDLSCVSFIYIIDPITDEGIEKQTIARAYRMREIVSKGGEERFPKDINCKSTFLEYLSFVKVTYCLVEDTIEDILYDYVKYKKKIQFNNKDINSRRNLNIKHKRSHTNRKTLSQGGQSHIRGSSQKLENILNSIKDDIEITENEDLIDNLDPTQALLRIFINK